MKKEKTQSKLVKFKSRAEWLTARMNGISATGAGAVLNVNPWETPIDIYERITHKIYVENEESEAMKKGNQAEPILRDLFKFSYQDKYKLVNPPKANWLIQRKDKPYMIATPDGLLTETMTGNKGGLECKYHRAYGKADAEEWQSGQLPQQYYVQVLHTMNVGKFKFYYLVVLLEIDKRAEDGKYVLDHYENRYYYFDAEELKEDLDYEESKMDEFWKHNIVERNIPPLVIKL